MKLQAILLAAVTLTACRPAKAPIAELRPVHAQWDGERFVCPMGMDEWVDEQQALEVGRDFVYCVPYGWRK